jgi:hypothetical protein
VILTQRPILHDRRPLIRHDGESHVTLDGMEEEDTFSVRHTISQTHCKQHIPVPPSASTERVGELASEIAVHRGTLARVCERSGFWGAYSRLLASSTRPALLRLYPVLIIGVVRGTALRTPSCIKSVRLH